MLQNIFDLFELNAKKFPDNIAIILSNKKKITYRNLLRDVNKLSYNLKYQGIKENEAVCIISEKSLEAYKFILACLKIGSPYFFLDPDQPLDRLLEIIKIGNPKLIFTQKKIDIKKSLLIDSFIKKEFLYKKNFLEVSSFISHAYYMFTSGSSGKPKGAIISQYNLKYLIEWAKNEYKFDEKTVHTALNPIFFDNSIFDFYATIGNAGTLVVLTNKEILNPETVIKVINSNMCNSWFSVPSLIKFYLSLKMFNKKNFKNLDRFIFGGEGFPITHLKKLYEIYGNTKIYSNVYGPTECTCICSSYNVSLGDLKSKNNFPPIGKLNYYFDGFLYDEISNKKSNYGELVLLGPAVGKGYLDNIENKGFKLNPIENRFKEIAYFTGDVMKYDKQNKLIFVSRKDNQIKHMGFRIEIEEIECRLRKIKFIEDVVITFISNPENSFLIATIKCNKDIKKKININYKKYLPKYMIPKHTRFVKSIPENKNGKLDRVKIKNKIIKIYDAI